MHKQRQLDLKKLVRIHGEAAKLFEMTDLSSGYL